MYSKPLGLALIFLVSFIFKAWGQVEDDYSLRFSGFKKLRPTQVCSVMDLVIVMQNTHKQLKMGANPKELVLMKGLIPSSQLKSPPSTEIIIPRHVFTTIKEALTLFFEKEGFDRSLIPETPKDRVYPADVLVVAALAFDTLTNHLMAQGVHQLGDSKLLRYRYTNQLTPPD